MKKALTLLALLTICFSITTALAETYLSVSDNQKVFTMQMVESTESDIPDWVILKNGKKIGTYGRLEEAYQGIPNKVAQKEIGIAFGQDYLKRFNSISEAKTGIILLEKSTGPNSLNLLLIKKALPTMKW